MCIQKLVENGSVSQSMLKAGASEEKGVVTGGAADLKSSPDDKLKPDPENGLWEGSVFYMELGNTVTMSEPLKGLYTLKNKEIIIVSDTSKETKISVL